jgi:hypothetical protein
MKTTCKNHRDQRGAPSKVKKLMRRYTDKQVLYKRDDTVRCKGCKLLFANLGSYLDHALWCEKLSTRQKNAIRSGKFLKSQGVILNAEAI